MPVELSESRVEVEIHIPERVSVFVHLVVLEGFFCSVEALATRQVSFPKESRVMKDDLEYERVLRFATRQVVGEDLEEKVFVFGEDLAVLGEDLDEGFGFGEDLVVVEDLEQEMFRFEEDPVVGEDLEQETMHPLLPSYAISPVFSSTRLLRYRPFLLSGWKMWASCEWHDSRGHEGLFNNVNWGGSR